MGKTSTIMPFLVLAIVLGSIVIEQMYDIEINIEDFAIILAPLGVAGAAKAAIQKAGQVKANIPSNLKNIIDHEVNEVLRKAGYKKADGS